MLKFQRRVKILGIHKERRRARGLGWSKAPGLRAGFAHRPTNSLCAKVCSSICLPFHTKNQETYYSIRPTRWENPFSEQSRTNTIVVRSKIINCWRRFCINLIIIPNIGRNCSTFLPKPSKMPSFLTNECAGLVEGVGN